MLSVNQIWWELFLLFGPHLQPPPSHLANCSGSSSPWKLQRTVIASLCCFKRKGKQLLVGASAAGVFPLVLLLWLQSESYSETGGFETFSCSGGRLRMGIMWSRRKHGFRAVLFSYKKGVKVLLVDFPPDLFMEGNRQ